MRRYYSREAYLKLVDLIRSKIPKIALSSDFISGFCSETEAQFSDTLTLIENVGYDMAYLFAYSMREKTHAYHNLNDNIPEYIKKKRLTLMIEKFRGVLKERNLNELNSYHLILVEGKAKRNNLKKDCLAGRTDTNKLCVFPDVKVSKQLPEFLKFNLNKNDRKFIDFLLNHDPSINRDVEMVNFSQRKQNYILDKFSHFEKMLLINNQEFSQVENTQQNKFLMKLFYGFDCDNNNNNNKLDEINIGDYVIVKINDCSTNTLFGTPICKVNSLNKFFEISEGQPYFHIKNYDNGVIYNMNYFNKKQNKEKSDF
jgi:tRNA A37 methylthiotransferase MiaB